MSQGLNVPWRTQQVAEQRLELSWQPSLWICSQVGLFPDVSAPGQARTDALRKGLLRHWGHSLPDDRQRAWVFLPNLPVGCCAGEQHEMGLSAKGVGLGSADWARVDFGGWPKPLEMLVRIRHSHQIKIL